MRALVNGRVLTNISVYDRGLAYGDGVFETIAVIQGQMCNWHKHADRLLDGCDRLNIEVPDILLLYQELLDFCGPDTGILKIVITRGNSTRGYIPDLKASPNRVFYFSAWPGYPKLYYTQGVDAVICGNRLANHKKLAGIKHLNRLDNVLAAGELVQQNAQEGLVLSQYGNVVEGTRTNVFIVLNGELHTPLIDECGIAGVMRATIIDMAHDEGIIVKIRNIMKEELFEAQELFVCNSLIGIWPVKTLDGYVLEAMNMSHKLQAKVNGISMAQLDLA